MSIRKGTTVISGKGADGINGTDGQDGYSPTATVSKSGDTATITIIDKNGTTTAQVSDGGAYTLPIASDSTLGGIKVGNNLSIDSNGVLSASGGGGDVPVYYWDRTSGADSKAFLTELIGKYRNNEPFVLIAKYYDSSVAMNVSNLCILALSQNINGEAYIYEIMGRDSLTHVRHNLYVDNYIVTSISLNNTTISGATESWTNTWFLNKYNTSSYTPSGNYNPATKKYVDDSVSSKQDTLVSGTNIKTINNTSLLGSGDITVGGSLPIYYWDRTTSSDSKALFTNLIDKYRNNESFILFAKYHDSTSNRELTNLCLFAIPRNINGTAYVFELTARDYVVNIRHDLTISDYVCTNIMCNTNSLVFYNDYEELINLPAINNVEVFGSLSSSDLGLQDELESGTNIKTINNTSLLGSGNLDISGGIEELTSPVHISTLEDGYYRLPSGCLVYAFSDTVELIKTITRSAILSISKKTINGVDGISYWFIEDRGDFTSDGTSTDLSDIGNTLYYGLVVEETEDHFGSSKDLTKVLLKTDIADNLTTNNSNKVLSAKQGYLLEQNKVDKETGKGLFSGSYTDLTNKPTIPDELSDLSDDSTHRLVTDTEKTTWNGKSDFSGDYDDLSNKPTIPSDTGDLTNGAGFITSSYHDSSKQDTLVSGTNIKTINNTSLLGSGDISISGGTATDVQINGTSITSNDVANIITESAYDSSTNKIATMSDVNGLVDLIYPVGSIYMSMSSTSPSTLFGGTWERLGVGRTLVSAGGDGAVLDTNSYTGRGTVNMNASWFPVGETGGEMDHTLTTGELASHNHSANSDSSYKFAVTQGNLYAQADKRLAPTNSGGPYYVATTDTNRGIDEKATTQNTGSGTGHNTMQPYLSVYMWKRTA